MDSLSAIVLVLAKSGRMLAQLLRDAGYRPVVVDCYADADLRGLAVETLQVADLGPDSLRPVLADVQRRYGVLNVVYGSGLEAHTASLAALHSQGWRLLGNSPAVFAAIQDKRDFFRVLADLQIPFPATVFTRPHNGDWLQKPLAGQGGRGIVAFAADAGHGGCYWQQRLQGVPMSLTFIAGGERVDILGCNRQWSLGSGPQPYLFAGIASGTALPKARLDQLGDWLGRLVAAYRLRGLCSLDFLYTAHGCQVLEINARIPASAQLYEPWQLPVGHRRRLFARHLQALAGPEPVSGRPVVRADPAAGFAGAYQVVYADRDWRIGAGVAWPSWVVDRPAAGAIIGREQPICSIIARCQGQAQVWPVLHQRRSALETLLNTGS